MEGRSKKTIIFLLSFVTCLLAIPREEFYSFGQNSGDTTVPSNDDGSSEQITLQFGSFSYFEKQYTNLFVNPNGVISFDAAVSTVTPQSFPLSGLFLIAPYWADVDTNGTGTVYYRETRDNDVLRQARNDIMTFFSRRFLPIFVFIATWDRVGHTDRTKEDASGSTNGFGGTPAQVGFNAGDGKRFFSVPGSLIMNIDSTTNVNIPGVWTFQVNGDIARCSDPEDMENSKP
ncbi:sushi, nidogen and EGF-like domain-containing protein 1 [Halichondria panicea]|uniref:sushi, nidogen and EGF-like domain-containing protein 1 n=1 Tax=Halichondria panicea TaxID=6063 RepID=UPI00312B4D3A